jgi:hypothetical protein
MSALQPINTTLDKPPPPFADRLRLHPLARHHRLVAQARGAAQHDTRPQGQSLRRLASLRKALENAGTTIQSWLPDDPFASPLSTRLLLDRQNSYMDFGFGTSSTAFSEIMYLCWSSGQAASSIL